MTDGHQMRALDREMLKEERVAWNNVCWLNQRSPAMVIMVEVWVGGSWFKPHRKAEVQGDKRTAVPSYATLGGRFSTRNWVNSSVITPLQLLDKDFLITDILMSKLHKYFQL